MTARIQILLCTGIVIIFISLSACSSAPKAFAIREIQSGVKSGLRLPLAREIRSREHFQQLAVGLRRQFPECDFPAAAPEIRWGDEMLIIILAGETPAGVRPRVTNVSIFGGALLVAWCKEEKPKEKVYLADGIEMPEIPEPPKPPETPFIIVVVGAFNGIVRFVESRGLLG